jgi:predicted nucleic acid-binding protein
MTVYVDTSAIFALLDHRDYNHPLASQRLSWLFSPDVTMMTSNYVVVESCALLQRRVGLEAVETFRKQILPVDSPLGNRTAT